MGGDSVRAGRATEAAVIQFFRLIGCSVYHTSDPGAAKGRSGYRGVMASPGVPDLLVFGPPPPANPDFAFFECKAAHARLTKAQRHFAELAERGGIMFAWGDVLAAMDLAVRMGWCIERNGVYQRVA